LLSLLYYSLFAAGVLLTLASFVSARARLLMFYILMFMTMGGIQIEVPLLGAGMRSYLALLLLAASGRTVSRAVAWLRNARILHAAVMLTAYLVVSNMVLSPAPSFKTTFENAGNFVFFLLCVAFMLEGTRRQVIWLLVVMGLGLFSNILAYMPRWVPFMSGVTIFGPIPHYQEPAGSGLFLLPLLLLALHTTRGNWTRLLILAALILITVATFITGARTPAIAYFVVLILYRRRLWWALLVMTAGIVAFTLLPETTQTQRMVDRIQQLSTAARTGTLQENPDAGMRIENIRIALEGFTEKPVFGWGINSWYSYRQQQTGMLGYELSTHSGWALLLFETGLVGVFLFFYFISRCLHGLRTRFTGSFTDDIGFVAVLLTVAILLLSLGGDSLLKRGSYTLFGLGAYSRCARLRMETSGRERE
jgi:O-antigen ligase